MASVYRLKTGKWRCEICCSGGRRSRVFSSRKEAADWGAEIERIISDGSLGRTMTLRDALEEYRRHVTPLKRGREFEDRRIRFYSQDPVADTLIGEITVRTFEDFVMRRMSVVSMRTGQPLTRGTLARDMTVFLPSFTGVFAGDT